MTLKMRPLIKLFTRKKERKKQIFSLKYFKKFKLIKTTK
ncbi:hypothetical protein SAMN05421761_10541 [Belliella pelovolcani]|uniref:Uncharacterized protein n=1 Tax=Belliella pelovolcani TaxID=529505 RepID=A0A1N7M2U3_9BACT|nr:hypothetical protein SAMN05421761_10541 [Belliella pelovolcani]